MCPGASIDIDCDIGFAGFELGQRVGNTGPEYAVRAHPLDRIESRRDIVDTTAEHVGERPDQDLRRTGIAHVRNRGAPATRDRAIDELLEALWWILDAFVIGKPPRAIGKQGPLALRDFKEARRNVDKIRHLVFGQRFDQAGAARDEREVDRVHEHIDWRLGAVRLDLRHPLLRAADEHVGAVAGALGEIGHHHFADRLLPDTAESGDSNRLRLRVDVTDAQTGGRQANATRDRISQQRSAAHIRHVFSPVRGCSSSWTLTCQPRQQSPTTLQ